VPRSDSNGPAQRTGPWTALAVGASVLPWLSWIAFVSFRPGVPPRGVNPDPVGLVWLFTVGALIVWSVVAWSARSLRLTERMKIVCAGVAAMLVWCPVLLITTVFYFFLALPTLVIILLPILLVVWWGAFRATLALCRKAIEPLLSSRA
jgi:hypothetical protein